MSLAQHLDDEDGSNNQILQAYDMLAGIRSKESVDVIQPVIDDKGGLGLADMNVAPMNMQQGSFSWAIDVVHDFEGQVVKSDITKCMKQSTYTELPAPICPRTSSTLGGYSMSFGANRNGTIEMGVR